MPKGTSGRKPCNIDGCEALSHCRGWCKIHYQRWTRTGDPLGLRSAWDGHVRVACSVEGCCSFAHARGWCPTHYRAWATYGDPLAPMRRRFRGDLAERLWSEVQKGGPAECWEWIGHRIPRGYGAFGHAGASYYAHRVSYEIHFGPIPEGLDVCHHCDNPPCANPAHLFLGTRLDNVRDMIAKGRAHWQKGVSHGI